MPVGVHGRRTSGGAAKQRCRRGVHGGWQDAECGAAAVLHCSGGMGGIGKNQVLGNALGVVGVCEIRATGARGGRRLVEVS